MSYTSVESLETELTFAVSSDLRSTPHGLKLKPNLKVGCAFDNYDPFVDTIDGKNTLHDTNGIVYQDIEEEETETNVSLDRPVTTESVRRRGRRRRQYESSGTNIEPYRKKPRMESSSMVPLDDPRRKNDPPN